MFLCKPPNSHHNVGIQSAVIFLKVKTRTAKTILKDHIHVCTSVRKSCALTFCVLRLTNMKYYCIKPSVFFANQNCGFRSLFQTTSQTKNYPSLFNNIYNKNLDPLQSPNSSNNQHYCAVKSSSIYF